MKHYFLCVLCLTIVAMPSYAQRSSSGSKKLGSKYNYVGSGRDGRILVHRGGENSDPRQGMFRTDGFFGYTDTLGREVVPLVYDYARDFSGGFAVVGRGEKGEERRFGIIDREGQEILPCLYIYVSEFSEGRARVETEKDSLQQYGYVDTLGRFVVPVKYDRAFDFCEGVACVATGQWSADSRTANELIDFTGKYGFIDANGAEVIPLDYDDASSFSEGLAAVGKMGKYYVKWGYVNAKGSLVIPCEYYEVSSFWAGRAIVCRVSGGKLKYGCINPAGQEILPCIYDWVDRTRMGTIWVGEGEDPMTRACSMLDGSGAALMDYKVYQVNPSGKYGQASAAIPDADGLLRFGVLDCRGRVIVPFKYDDVTLFSEWDTEINNFVERGLAVLDGQEYPFVVSKPKEQK